MSINNKYNRTQRRISLRINYYKTRMLKLRKSYLEYDLRVSALRVQLEAYKSEPCLRRSLNGSTKPKYKEEQHNDRR